MINIPDNEHEYYSVVLGLHNLRALSCRTTAIDVLR